MSVLRRLRQLEEENGRPKQLIADLLLDKHMLLAALRKKSEARPPSKTGSLVARHLSGQLLAGLSCDAVQSSRLVSPELGQGSIRPPAPHS